MNKKDLALAQAKVKELFDLIKSTSAINRISLSWEKLSVIRLEVMKSAETWQGAVKIAILNFLQKISPDEDPALPKEVIDFLNETK